MKKFLCTLLAAAVITFGFAACGNSTTQEQNSQAEQSSGATMAAQITNTENSDYSYTLLDNGTAEITEYSGSDTEITIPSTIDGYTVTSIGSAFYNTDGACDELTSVIIPDSVTNIGGKAFSGCESLASITIPDSVVSIGNNAFENTAWYESQSDGVVYAGKVAYKYKGEMPANTSLTLESGTKGIAAGAFSDCNCGNLTNINIPDSVTNIVSGEFGTFEGTAWYDNQPDGIVYAGKVAYSYKGEMPANTSLTLDDDTKGIASEAFGDCANLVSIEIPESVAFIGNGAFACTTSNTYRRTSINVADGNQYYSSENGVLFNKDKTELISYPAGKTDGTYTIPDGVKYIGDGAFLSCDNLKSITIPDSVTYIGDCAFENNSDLNNVNIPNGVTYIGDYAFGYCASASLTIPDGVTYIGECAFSGCDITNAVIPDSVTSIGSNAFENTTWYSSQPDGVIYAGKIAYGYKGSTSETDITLEDGTIGIADSAFYMDNRITTVTIPDGVSKIGSQAFVCCENLTDVTIPDSVTSIGYNAFDDCTNLTIHGYSGSIAEKFANKNGFTFVAQ